MAKTIGEKIVEDFGGKNAIATYLGIECKQTVYYWFYKSGRHKGVIPPKYLRRIREYYFGKDNDMMLNLIDHMLLSGLESDAAFRAL